MTLRQWAASGSDGTTLTGTINSATVVVQNSNTVKYDSASKGLDSTGLLFTQNAGTASNNTDELRWAPSGMSSTQMLFEGVLNLIQIPTVTGTIFAVRHSSGVICRVAVNANGQLLVLDLSSATIVQIPAVTAGKYRLALGFDFTAGTVRTALYPSPSSTTVISGTTLSGSGANFGSNTSAVGVAVGSVGGLAAAFSVGWSDLQVNDGTNSGFIGPWSATAPAPTVSLGGNRTAVPAGSNVTLSATVSNATSYQWSVTRVGGSNPSLSSSATAASPTYVAGPAGTLDIVTCTVTGAGGTASATQEVRVDSTGAMTMLAQDATKSGTVSRGGATVSTDGAVLNLIDDSAWLELTQGSSLMARGIPVTTRTGWAVNYRVAASGSGTINCLCSLYCGNTKIQDDVTQAISTTDPTTYTLTLTSSAVSAITDWENLRVKVAAS